jgi:hypothetical protein
MEENATRRKRLSKSDSIVPSTFLSPLIYPTHPFIFLI